MLLIALKFGVWAQTMMHPEEKNHSPYNFTRFMNFKMTAKIFKIFKPPSKIDIKTNGPERKMYASWN